MATISHQKINYSAKEYGICYKKLRYHSLHHAVTNMRVSQIRLLMKIHPELINYKTESGLTPLMIACLLTQQENVKEQIIKMLIHSPYFDPYIKDNADRSGIFYIINFSNNEILKYYLNVTKFNYYTEIDLDGYTLLHYGVIRGDLDIMATLMITFKENKVDLNPLDLDNQSPLLLACKLGLFKLGLLLVKLGALPLSIRDNGQFRNCLDWLNYNRNTKMVNDENKIQLRFNNFMLTREQTLPELISNRSNNKMEEFKLSARSHSCYPSINRSNCFSFNTSKVPIRNSRHHQPISLPIVTEINSMSWDECTESLRHYFIYGTFKQITSMRRKRVSIKVDNIARYINNNNNCNNSDSRITSAETTIGGGSSGRTVNSAIVTHEILNCLAREMQVIDSFRRENTIG